jgi:ATP-dependent DNA helicase DinG
MLEEQILKGVHDILGPDGLLVRDGAGRFSFNADQLNYAISAAKGFCRDREDKAAAVNMLQAATGTGKTLGYLVPAMLYAAHSGGRVIVSTYTRHLQHQIVTGDAPKAAAWVKELTGKKLLVCRRVGQRNYLSPIACQDYLARLESDDKAAQSAIGFMEDLCEWLAGLATGAPLIDDFLNADGRESNSLPDGIDGAQLCISSLSPKHELQAYKDAVAATHNADIVVSNHAITMINASRWASVLDGDRKSDLLICDEADRLTDAAEAVLSADLSLHRLLGLTEAVASAFKKPQIGALVKDLYDSVKAVKDDGQVLALLPANIAAKSAKALEQLKTVAKSFAEQLTTGQQLDVGSPNRLLMCDFIDSINDLDRICTAAAADNANSISLISWSPVKSYPSLRIGRPEPAGVLARMVSVRDWDSGDSDDELLPPRSYLRACLFTSATMATPGKTLPASFDAFAKKVGVIRHCAAGSATPIHNVTTDLFGRFEPKKFGKMSFVLADPQVEAPSFTYDNGSDYTVITSPEWLSYCAMMIRTAAARPGRTLVLTLSFANTKGLSHLLGDLPGLIVHRQGESISGLAERYKADANATLITPSGWEGLDLPGMVPNLVITRIPFSAPDSFRSSLYEIDLCNKGMSADKVNQIIFGMMSESARRKLEQGLGRGIRSKDDEVCVFIADPRFPQPESFSESLDPVLMQPNLHRQRKSFIACIPKRFKADFEKASILLKDGALHVPEAF